MERKKDLTWPLRVGPWWVGMLMLLLFTPLAVIGVFVETADAFGEAVMDASDEFREAFLAIWRDR